MADKETEISKQEQWEKRFRWLAEQHWVQAEAEFRLDMCENEQLDVFMLELTQKIDALLLNNESKQLKTTG
jgi:hypothetical protein